MFFCPEGLEEELEVEYESPDFVAPAIVQEMLARAEGKIDPRYLRILERGRRYGQREHPPINHYFLLRPEEVERFAGEMRRLYELPAPWDDADVAGIVSHCLLDDFETVAKQG